MDCKKEIKGLRAEIATLRNVCGEAYQLAGTYGADVKALDNLLAAASAIHLDGLSAYRENYLG
jgi:hypothetical protein